MQFTLTHPVKYLRGVGPQRAAALEERGIATVGDLLSYLPFRYEDRIRFTPIAEAIPGQVHTILAEVAEAGSTVRFARARSANLSCDCARRFRQFARAVFSRRLSGRTG